jgi:antitoxin ChpS
MTTDPAKRPAAGDIRAIAAFLERLRGTYDVSQTIMFGSRARGDHRPDSDLDLAVVLNGERGDFVDTKLDMAGLAFDVLMETGVLVQAFPLWQDDLAHPERFSNPALVRAIVREGIVYQRREHAARHRALDELVQQAQELGLGD